jgi:hypothetical protein
VVTVAKTTSEEPRCSRAAPHAGSHSARITILLDEGLSRRRDGLNRAWVDWLAGSIPQCGSSKTLRGAGIWEAMRAPA